METSSRDQENRPRSGEVDSGVNLRQARLERAEAIRNRLWGAPARRRVRNHARLTRTILLGSVAVALAIAWLADAYDVETRDLLSALRASLGFVGIFAALAVLGGLLLGLGRSFVAKRRRRASED